MALEDDLTRLCAKNHKYLQKGQQLLNVYVPDESIKASKNYKKILLAHSHVLDKVFKTKPKLKTALLYDSTYSKDFDNSYKIYNRLLESNPKDMSSNDICIYKTVWEAIHLATMLDEISKNANNNVVLEQSLVAMCTAYEFFVKDTFKWLLDNFPLFAKKYLGNLSSSIKEAGKYDFDLINNAGNLFLDREGQNFKIFENAKKLYSDTINFDLFKNQSYEKEIWKIFQTRHCIVHNGGEADSIWKRNMKNKELKIDPKTLTRYIIFMHMEFHSFYFRLYKQLFNKNPPDVHETKEKLKINGYAKFPELR